MSDLTVTGFRLQSPVSVTLLPAVDARPTDRFILKDLGGMGPVDINNQISNGTYRGRIANPRQIVARIQLNPQYDAFMTAEKCRQELYHLLAGQCKAQVMENTAVRAESICFPSKFEIVPFTDTPEVQVTFDCLGSYLVAPVPINYNVGDFDYPSWLVNAAGNVDVGIGIQIKFNELTHGWGWARGDNSESITFNRDFPANSVLEIVTTVGYRRADLNGVSILNSVQPGLSWLQLRGGVVNQFHSSVSNFTWNLFQYTPAWWGI